MELENTQKAKNALEIDLKKLELQDENHLEKEKSLQEKVKKL